MPKVICSLISEDCQLGECKKCSGASGITLQSIGLLEKNGLDDIVFAIWNKGNLKKRITPTDSFVEELSTCTEEAEN